MTPFKKYLNSYLLIHPAQHGLVQVFYTTRKPTNSGSLLTKTEVEEANKAVAKILESIPKTGASRGKYNSYMSVQRAELGKYAAENGATSAVKHFPQNGTSV